ncbi:MAG: ImmA/IrrE family metallo-endopeptidase [Chroococcales cyanobacterium]
MTPTEMFMSTLYDRLSAIGFDKAFIRSKALPHWWDAEFEATEGAVVEAATYISRRLNLDLTSLLKPDAIPTFKPASPGKFKLKPGTEIEQLKVAYGMASRVAEMVAYACIPEFKSLPNSAQQMRDEILTTLNPLEPSLPNSPVMSIPSFVNLERLLEFCWSYGIPVVHLDDFPTTQGVRKFEGLVTFFSNRPVIILSLKHRSFARLLFTLAHQLGHFIKGHGKGFSILDEEIDPESLDPEELEANEFALELLLGKPDMGYYTPRIFTEKQLAGYAQTVSVRDRVDPGLVALNYAWNKANRATTKNEQLLILETAQKALNFLERNVDATATINRYLHKHLDLERLDIDSQDYLDLVTAR